MRKALQRPAESGPCKDGFEYVKALAEKTGVAIPYGLCDLDKKPVLHKGVIASGQMQEAVLEALR